MSVFYRELPLRCIYSAGQADLAAIPVVETEMTQKDCELYDRIGWDKYSPEDFRERFLPTLGEPRLFRGGLGSGLVVPIAGRRFVVRLVGRGYDSRDGYDNGDYGDVASHEGKKLLLQETEEPLSVPDGKGSVKFFGQPTWVQNPHFRLDSRGQLLRNLFTDENGWGDCGNWNVLVGLDENGIPDEAYFEASCC